MQSLRNVTIVVAFAFCIVMVGATQPRNVEDWSGAVNVQYSGESGQIRLAPEKLLGRFFKAQLDKMSEMTPLGAATVNSARFSTLFGKEWTGPTRSSLLDFNGTAVNTSVVTSLSTFPLNGASVTVNITSHLFDKDVVMRVSNRTFPVEIGSAFVTVGITGWPFLDPANMLAVYVDLTTSSSKGPSRDIVPLEDDRVRYFFDQTGFVELGGTSLVDGMLAPIVRGLSTATYVESVVVTLPRFWKAEVAFAVGLSHNLSVPTFLNGSLYAFCLLLSVIGMNLL
eukprot:Opistho-2@62787